MKQVNQADRQQRGMMPMFKICLGLCIVKSANLMRLGSIINAPWKLIQNIKVRLNIKANYF